MIALTPMARLDSILLEEVKSAVESAFGRQVIVTDPVPLPSSAHDEERDQWRASMLLETLHEHLKPGWERLLGIADVDLHAPGLNFVFGEADPRRGVAVFSIARLGTVGEATEVRGRRIRTEAVHELGHTYGLGHCSRHDCVMWFSNTLAETDRKGAAFCEAHARELARALKSQTPIA